MKETIQSKLSIQHSTVLQNILQHYRILAKISRYIHKYLLYNTFLLCLLYVIFTVKMSETYS